MLTSVLVVRAIVGLHVGSRIVGDLVWGIGRDASSVDEPVSGKRSVESVGTDDIGINHHDSVSLSSDLHTAVKQKLTLLALISAASAEGTTVRDGEEETARLSTDHLIARSRTILRDLLSDIKLLSGEGDVEDTLWVELLQQARDELGV